MLVNGSMKNLLFIFCFFILFSAPLTEASTAAALQQTVSELEKTISELEKRKVDLEAQIKSCSRSNCSAKRIELSTVKSNLSVSKSKLEVAQSNLGAQTQRESLQTQQGKEDRDSKKTMSKQKKLNNAVAVANVGMAAWMFKSCSGGTVPVYCMMGAMNLIQAAGTLNSNNGLEKTRSSFDSGASLLGSLDDSPTLTNPTCTGPSCSAVPIAFENLSDRLVELNSTLGCADPCLELAPDGTINPVRTPSGVKIEKSDSDPNRFTAAQKKEMQKIADNFRNNNKGLFAEAEALLNEEDLDSNEVGLNMKKLVGDFTPGAGGSSANALVGNEEDGVREKSISDQVNDLLSQFKQKKGARGLAGKTVTVGKDQVGIVQDNIFLMVHRRYQEKRTNKEFIESKRGQDKPFRQQI